MIRTFVAISGILGIVTALWSFLDREYLPAGIWGVASIAMLIASRSFDLPGED